MDCGVVDGDHGAILFVLRGVAAAFYGFVAGVVGGHLRDGYTEEVQGSGEGFVRAEEEIALEGLLACF
jgi:hypothetical protein